MTESTVDLHSETAALMCVLHVSLMYGYWGLRRNSQDDTRELDYT
jgi:hypothetical protein